MSTHPTFVRGHPEIDANPMTFLRVSEGKGAVSVSGSVRWHHMPWNLWASQSRRSSAYLLGLFAPFCSLYSEPIKQHLAFKFSKISGSGCKGATLPPPTPITRPLAVVCTGHRCWHPHLLASLFVLGCIQMGRSPLDGLRSCSINRRLLTERQFTTNISTRSILSFSVTLEKHWNLFSAGAPPRPHRGGELTTLPISPTPQHSASTPRMCPPHYFTAGDAPAKGLYVLLFTRQIDLPDGRQKYIRGLIRD